jgi:hypothetical protein
MEAANAEMSSYSEVKHLEQHCLDHPRLEAYCFMLGRLLFIHFIEECTDFVKHQIRDDVLPARERPEQPDRALFCREPRIGVQFLMDRCKRLKNLIDHDSLSKLRRATTPGDSLSLSRVLTSDLARVVCACRKMRSSDPTLEWIFQ